MGPKISKVKIRFVFEIREVSDTLTPNIGKCQCRHHRAQRNHIACCLSVWVSLRRAAEAAGQTIYQLKTGLLEDYIRQQLQKPAISINIA